MTLTPPPTPARRTGITANLWRRDICIAYPVLMAD
jgi:hypothetical protein